MSNTTEFSLNYLTIIPSHYNYINNSLIDIYEKRDYNIINTDSIFYFLKYKESTMSNDNTISSDDKTDK